MNTKLENLKKELEIAIEKNAERISNAPYDMGYQEYLNYISKTSDKVESIDRQIRMLEEPTYSDIPKYGDVMSLNDFIDAVKDGSFIDYDGSGNYIKDGKMSDISIYPSDVENGCVRKEFDSIVWFNR